MDFATLDWLRQNHPAWRLLNSPHAALIVSFLHRVFVLPNERVITQADLAEALEDELFALREGQGNDAFPKSALDYLNDWAGGDKGWLRKFYRHGSDEPYFDLTPATEKAIGWLGSLTARAFVGTESRLLTLFELLRQIDAGSEADPAVEGTLPAVHGAGARPAVRLSRGRAELPHARPLGARTYHAVGGQQGRAARGDHGGARRDHGFRSGSQLSRLLGLPDVERATGRVQ
jgi:hypothetical protein